MVKPIPISLVNERLEYCPDTGVFQWVKPPAKAGKDPSQAGSIDAKGYRVININGTSYKAHRIAWAIATGEQPPENIDHIDGNPLNNAISNLRDGTNRVNQLNRQQTGLGVVLKTVNGHKYWYATYRRKHLYCGKDFFEACCRRFSAEANDASHPFYSP